jgi:hypothetical protein
MICTQVQERSARPGGPDGSSPDAKALNRDTEPVALILNLSPELSPEPSALSLIKGHP